jgi:hypothetical protein
MNSRRAVVLAVGIVLAAAVAVGATAFAQAASNSAHRVSTTPTGRRASDPRAMADRRVSRKVLAAYRAFERRDTPVTRRAAYHMLLAHFAALRKNPHQRQSSSGVWLSVSPSEACISYALPSKYAPQTAAGACNSNLADVALGGLFVIVPAGASGDGVPRLVEMVPNATQSVTLTDRLGNTRVGAPSENVVSIPDPAYVTGAPAFQSLTVTSVSGQRTTW